MRTAYVIMSSFYSPRAIVIPTPKFVFFNKKKANDFCKSHNDNPRTSTEFYVRKVQIAEES